MIGRINSCFKIFSLRTNLFANSVAEIYLSNYKIVSALACSYGFKYYFFWQPHLGIDTKSLTIEELYIRSTMDSKLIELVIAVYDRIYSLAPDYENLFYIANILIGHDEQIWIDTLGHITPEGNRLVAQKMLSVIEPQLVQN